MDPFVKITVTSQNPALRLSAGQPVPLEKMRKGSPDPTAIIVDPTLRRQTILGFGGAFTEAAACTFSKLTEPEQRRIIGLYFDPREGLGYTTGLFLGSCDFALETYDYVADGDSHTARRCGARPPPLTGLGRPPWRCAPSPRGAGACTARWRCPS
jgi:glucosylceramidase